MNNKLILIGLLSVSMISSMEQLLKQAKAEADSVRDLRRGPLLSWVMNHNAIVVEKRLANGELDSSFGSDGYTVTKVGTKNYYEIYYKGPCEVLHDKVLVTVKIDGVPMQLVYTANGTLESFK